MISSVCNESKVNQIIALWNEYFKTHELHQKVLAGLSELAGRQVFLEDDTDTAVGMRRCVRTMYLPTPNRRKDAFAFF